MGVDVDEPGRHDLPARVDHAAGRARRAALDGDDAARANAHVGVESGRAGTVDHVTASDQQIVHHSSMTRSRAFTVVERARPLRTATGAPTRA